MSAELEAAAAEGVAELVRHQRRKMPPPGATCPNCGVELEGPFCHVCGQGTDNHKRSILRLTWESVKDLLSWDGRFLRTVPALFFRPGHLARDYMEGRVARHVPPFRTFLIALVVFIFSIEHWVDGVRNTAEDQRQKYFVQLSTPQGRVKEADTLRAAAVKERTEELAGAAADRMGALAGKDADPPKVEAEYQAEVARAEAEYAQDLKRAEGIRTGEIKPNTFGADFKLEIPKEASGANEDVKWLEDGFRKAVANPDYYFTMVFSWGQRGAILLLPILALSLGLAYLNKRKYFLFDHLVVAMNLLSFQFLASSIVYLAPGQFGPWLSVLVFLWLPIHAVQTLRGAYGSSMLGAILKSLFILTIFSLAFTVLMIAVLVFSFRQMA